MQPFSENHFEELKLKVLKRATIACMHPEDVPELQKVMEEQTGHRLSEVTLRRVFNFMDRKFAPSFFILSVLSLYCGYADWDSFYSAILNATGLL